MSGSWSNNLNRRRTRPKATPLEEQQKPPKPFLSRLFLIVCDTTKRFYILQGLPQAAALAFYALLSLLPIVMLILILAALIFGNTAQVQDFINEQISELAPWAEDTLQTAINDPGGHIVGLGWISLIFIIWTSGLFFAQLQRSLLMPWAARQLYHGRLWRHFIPWVIGPALALVSGGGMLLMNMASYLPTGWLPDIIRPKLFAWLISAVFILIAYYLFLPARRLQLHVTAALAALLSGAELALSSIFAAIIVKSPQYTFVYGSMAAIILFLVWVYYSMTIIVFGGYFLESWFHINTLKQSQKKDQAPEK